MSDESATKTAKTRIEKVTVKKTADETPDFSLLGKYTSNPDDYYLDRKEGVFRGPHVAWEQTTAATKEPFFEKARGHSEEEIEECRKNMEKGYGVPMTRDNAIARIAQELYDDAAPEEILANGCSRNYERNEDRYLVPGQHLPHNPVNWGHVANPTITEDDKKRFEKVGIVPVVTDERPAAFWLSALYAVEDCERVESMSRGNWEYIGIEAEFEVVHTDAKGNEFPKTIQSGGVWGIESDSGESYFQEIGREQIAECLDQLRDHEITDEEIAEAIREHVGEEYVPESLKPEKSQGVRR